MTSDDDRAGTTGYTTIDNTDEACGDYPAPCNCDYPTTHDGAIRVETTTAVHEHNWRRQQNITSRGYGMLPIDVCWSPGCDAARPHNESTTATAVEVATEELRSWALIGDGSLKVLDKAPYVYSHEEWLDRTILSSHVIDGRTERIEGRPERIVQVLADAGLLATACTRDEIDLAVGEVLFNSMNHPNPSAVMGRDMSPLRNKIVEAVMNVLGEGT